MGADFLTYLSGQRTLSERDFRESVFSFEETERAAEQLKLFRTRNSPQKPANPPTIETDDSSFASGAQIYQAIEKLFLSQNMPRDRRIADRLTALYRDAISEGESIRAGSVAQFANFFLQHVQLGVPKITLTPDGTLRSRWIQGPENFLAIEFIGGRFARIVAELPRANGETATYFCYEELNNVLHIAGAMGAALT